MKEYKAIIIQDILRAKNKPSNQKIIFTDIATTLLVRDYKGLSNYANGVLEIEKDR